MWWKIQQGGEGQPASTCGNIPGLGFLATLVIWNRGWERPEGMLHTNTDLWVLEKCSSSKSDSTDRMNTPYLDGQWEPRGTQVFLIKTPSASPSSSRTLSSLAFWGKITRRGSRCAVFAFCTMLLYLRVRLLRNLGNLEVKKRMWNMAIKIFKVYCTTI